jgi:hypothetical protein
MENLSVLTRFRTGYNPNPLQLFNLRNELTTKITDLPKRQKEIWKSPKEQQTVPHYKLASLEGIFSKTSKLQRFA